MLYEKQQYVVSRHCSNVHGSASAIMSFKDLLRKVGPSVLGSRNNCRFPQKPPSASSPAGALAHSPAVICRHWHVGRRRSCWGNANHRPTPGQRCGGSFLNVPSSPSVGLQRPFSTPIPGGVLLSNRPRSPSTKKARARLISTKRTVLLYRNGFRTGVQVC